MRKSICIGIPCFQSASFETLDDYMRFAYHLGRRCQEYDFFLAVKGKSEQFRARNAIIESALQYDCDYIFMLDDDHVIDTDKTLGPTSKYDFLVNLAKRMEADPTIGIIGGLYYQRGGDYYPVVMHEHKGEVYFLTHNEITRRMQRVAVTGGGCMLIRREVFDKIESPWFEPEQQTNGPSRGTDIQICRKAEAAGFSVWCDTSVELGHVRLERDIVTSQTVVKYLKEKANGNNP